jgi:hypothetical protein
MMMTSGLRMLALTVHMTTSVGWLGSVAAFLDLAIAGERITRQQLRRVVVRSH